MDLSEEPERRVGLVVYGRQPRAGETKTRLAASIGDDGALAVYEALLARVLGEALASGLEARLSLAEAAAPSWRPPISLPTEVQLDGDLGARMQQTFALGFARGYDALILVGSDIPGISRAHLMQAVALLARVPVVLGPAEDGGYYLIAQRAPGVEMFSGIPWSSPRTMAETRARLAQLGVKHEEIEALRDVDTVEDLRRAAADARIPGPLRALLRRFI
jgi:hypothetical protein